MSCVGPTPIKWQLTGDSGSGADLSSLKSPVYAVSPQTSCFFPVGGRTWYVNLRGYHEFDAKNRPEGWKAWLRYPPVIQN